MIIAIRPERVQEIRAGLVDGVGLGGFGEFVPTNACNIGEFVPTNAYNMTVPRALL